MRGILTAALLLGLGLPALLPAHAAAASAVACDQQCQLAAAWAAQQADALPRTAFYDAPSPLPPAPLGTLIRSQETAAYVVNGEQVSAIRILYHSRTSAGRDVAASGVVLTPPGAPPRGGWPVVVDTHGTSGFAEQCAPSLMKDLYHGDQMERFVQQGWAVVAPDYAGLGTNGQDQLTSITAEANDALGALSAAHHAAAGLSGQWVIWGHSLGGQAALGVAEHEFVRPDPGYRGAVVTSPASDLAGVLDNAAYNTSGPLPLSAFVPLIVDGAKVSVRGLDLARILTPAARARLGVSRTGCLGVLGVAYEDLTGNALVEPDFLNYAPFARYLRDNTPGGRPVRGPVLLLQGSADTVIPQRFTDQLAANLRSHGTAVDYRVSPGLLHDTIPGLGTGIDDGAMPVILGWVAQRFGPVRAAALG